MSAFCLTKQVGIRDSKSGCPAPTLSAFVMLAWTPGCHAILAICGTRFGVPDYPRWLMDKV
jgi:hypothetical protein